MVTSAISLVSRRTIVFVPSLLLLAASTVTATEDIEIAYSFRNGPNGQGGVALVYVDRSEGTIVRQEPLFASAECVNAAKLRRTPDRKMFVLSNESKRGTHIFLVDRRRSLDITRLTPGTDKTDEVRVAGQYALVTCEDDCVYRIDLKYKRVNGQFDAKKFLDPPGNRPQDIFIFPNQQFAVTSIQKDRQDEGRYGSRLIVFSYPRMGVQADIELPRDYPELHITVNPKEQGPGPEVVFVSERTNTLFATLDLYGAVALMDWDAAQQGKLARWTYLSTSVDGEFGVSFPDRVLPLSDGNVLVCNAGRDGGAVIVDLQGRGITWHGKSPSGLDSLVFLEQLQSVYAACPGKTKWRTETDVERQFQPRSELYILDPRNEDQESNVRAVTAKYKILRLTRVGQSEILLVAAGKQKGSATHLLTFDARAERFLDERLALGDVAQFEGD